MTGGSSGSRSPFWEETVAITGSTVVLLHLQVLFWVTSVDWLHSRTGRHVHTCKLAKEKWPPRCLNSVYISKAVEIPAQRRLLE